MLGMKLRQILFLLLVMSMSVLSACGGGGSDSSSSDSGEVVVSFTDAEGDFVNYTVDVLSVKLTRADGTQVETLPLNTRINFVDYTNLTEFLSAATVPAGLYVKGSILLDYSNADIWVEDASGAAKQVSQVLDVNGDPVTTLEVNVALEGGTALPIAPGIPKNLMLDFDLQQSHTVDVNDPATITVDPLFIASVDPVTTRSHRLRGPLRDVDVANNAFSLYLRPFYHRLGIGQRIFGNLRVLTDEKTMYEIDGVSYEGTAGLSVLDTLADFTAVIAVGDIKFEPLRFVAREVYAGSSVPGGNLDAVRGTVTSRSVDNRITIQGATLFRTDGTILFNDKVTVQLDPSTSVTKQLSVGSYTMDDISVGQRILVFGTVTDDSLSNLQLSAVNGFARMSLSAIAGNVTALPAAGGDLQLNLFSINGRNPAIYDFTGTGSPGNDADPANYAVNTSSLSLSSVAVSDDVFVRGFPTPFGSAPSDYTATSVIKP